ncbi:MAG: Gfo/Idh/MocA family oxidoreductase [Clostridiales bacterium]|nr:Gfo/Idh/MocA family oxidoreductase [Clostridiales bacterium]
MSDIRYGIIGCGNIARAHLPSCIEGEGIVCGGLTDRIDGLAEKLSNEYGGGFRIFKSAEEMVESPDIDAVILAVPNYQHRPMFELAAKNGKHILCEKPLTMTVADGEAMVEIAHKYGVKTQMGLCTRFESYVDAMKEQIDAGLLGDVYFARADLLRMRGAPMGWFGNSQKSGGGPLIDIGVHFIDACWYLLGKPKPVRVKALNYHQIPNRYPKNVDIYKSFEPDTVYDVEDSSHGLITFENGAGLMYQAAWSINAEDVDDRLEVYGSKGGLVKNPCKRISEEATGMTVTSIMAKENNCYTAQLEDFARVIKGEHASRTPVEDGLQIQKILNGLYLSAKTGKEVEL